MSEIIDVSFDCGNKAVELRNAGVKTIIRYYTRDSSPTSGKRLGSAEAGQLGAAGLRIAIVHEGKRGNKIDNFSHATGLLDSAYARTYASGTIGQPSGSAIYFGIDTDATKAEIKARIIPYFRGVSESMATPTEDPSYTIGVYSSGAVCQALLDAGLVELSWLAQSTGWLGYKVFLDSGKWTILQKMPSIVAGVSCDPDVAGSGPAIGDFKL